jgi:hypothetical protein
MTLAEFRDVLNPALLEFEETGGSRNRVVLLPLAYRLQRYLVLIAQVHGRFALHTD